jgi:general secretion pathway protein A
MLARRELRQLAQRITARYHLSPLDSQETADYIRHRLKVAGGEGKVTFTPGALAAVHRAARGVPRLVNLICDRALLGGYVHGTRVVDAAMVRRAASELGGPLQRRSHAPSYVLAGLGVVAAALVAAIWLPGVAPAPPGIRDALPATLAPQPAPLTTTPVAAPMPATPATVPAPVPAAIPTPGVLESLILSLPHEGSLQSSSLEIQTRWGRGSLERTPARTHLDQLRRLDMPVILEMFHPARRDTCFLALLHLDNDAALLSTGSAEMLVPVAELDRFWTRQAVFLWRDFEAVARSTERERTATWARAALERLGYGEAQADLAAAVSRFQRDADLAPDGVIGSRTLLALYSRGDYPRPRLTAGSSGLGIGPGGSS